MERVWVKHSINRALVSTKTMIHQRQIRLRVESIRTASINLDTPFLSSSSKHVLIIWMVDVLCLNP